MDLIKLVQTGSQGIWGASEEEIIQKKRIAQSKLKILLIMWTFGFKAFKALWIFLLLAESAAPLSGRAADDLMSVCRMKEIKIMNGTIQIIASNNDGEKENVRRFFPQCFLTFICLYCILCVRILLKGVPTCPCSRRWTRVVAARRERTSPATVAWNAPQDTCNYTQTSSTCLTHTHTHTLSFWVTSWAFVCTGA